MKLVFVHDHKLAKFKSTYYTTGGFSDTITNRYTSIFDEMVLICRSSNVNDISRFVKIDNKNVKVRFISGNTLFPNKETIKMMRKEISNSDNVIVRLPSILGIYASFISFKMGKKLCVEVVGNIFGSYWYKSTLGKIVAVPLELLDKKIIKKAKYVLYVSDIYLQKKYPNNNLNIGCSDVILEKRDSNVLKERLNKISSFNKKQKIIIGTLAQYNQKYKGHETVFRSIAKLKKDGYKFEYRLAGTGDSSMILKLISKYGLEDDVILNGLIKHDNINEWFDEIDIYIQPSLTEGIPRSVIEALYRACPVIVSTAGGMYELVDKKFIFKKGNHKELTSIIEKISTEDLKEMAKNNFNFSSKFDPDYLNEKREKFYKEFRNGDTNEEMV